MKTTRYLAFLREPVARALSEYRHVTEGLVAQFGEHVFGKAWDYDFATTLRRQRPRCRAVGRARARRSPTGCSARRAASARRTAPGALPRGDRAHRRARRRRAARHGRRRGRRRARGPLAPRARACSRPRARTSSACARARRYSVNAADAARLPPHAFLLSLSPADAQTLARLGPGASSSDCSSATRSSMLVLKRTPPPLERFKSTATARTPATRRARARPPSRARAADEARYGAAAVARVVRRNRVDAALCRARFDRSSTASGRRCSRSRVIRPSARCASSPTTRRAPPRERAAR